MFTADELAALAKAYCDATSMTLHALGMAAMGNHRFFKLLIAGRGAHSANIERASNWFRANWPDEARWPADVPDRRSEMAAD